MSMLSCWVYAGSSSSGSSAHFLPARPLPLLSLSSRPEAHPFLPAVILRFGTPGKRASVLVFSGERAAAPSQPGGRSRKISHGFRLQPQTYGSCGDEPLLTASGGNFKRGEINRNERAAWVRSARRKSQWLFLSGERAAALARQSRRLRLRTFLYARP